MKHVQQGLLTLGLALVLAGCANNENRVAYDGFFFKARAKEVDEDRSRFVVTVFKVSQTIQGAREAGAHEATRYCIENFGTSRIAWIVPPDTPLENLAIVDDTVAFEGECNP
ncbi:MAG: hypothetical protein AB3N13_10825 [Arenibacterium sp.]